MWAETRSTEVSWAAIGPCGADGNAGAWPLPEYGYGQQDRSQISAVQLNSTSTKTPKCRCAIRNTPFAPPGLSLASTKTALCLSPFR